MFIKPVLISMLKNHQQASTEFAQENLLCSFLVGSSSWGMQQRSYFSSFHLFGAVKLVPAGIHCDRHEAWSTFHSPHLTLHWLMVVLKIFWVKNCSCRVAADQLIHAIRAPRWEWHLWLLKSLCILYMGSFEVDLIKVKLNFSSFSTWSSGKPREGPQTSRISLRSHRSNHPVKRGIITLVKGWISQTKGQRLSYSILTCGLILSCCMNFAWRRVIESCICSQPGFRVLNDKGSAVHYSSESCTLCWEQREYCDSGGKKRRTQLIVRGHGSQEELRLRGGDRWVDNCLTPSRFLPAPVHTQSKTTVYKLFRKCSRDVQEA